MEIKDCIVSDKIIISPLEIRHYLIDLPPLKASFRKDAVIYALRTLYPGTQESAVFDYCYFPGKTIGIAAPSRKVEAYRAYQKELVSPVLVAAHAEQNAVTVCVSDTWILVQVMRRGIPQVLSCTGLPEPPGKSTVESVLADEAYGDLPVRVYTCSETDGNAAEKYGRCRNAEFRKFSTLLTSAVVSGSAVFRPEKKGPSIVKILPVVLLLFVCGIFGIADGVLYRQAAEAEAGLQSVKQTYRQKKEETGAAGTKQPAAAVQIPQSVSLTAVLWEIESTSPGIRLDSCSVTGSTFQFEAENAHALPVLEHLKRSALIENAVLYQAVPLDTGGERFIISGKLKHE